jgi:5-methylcytosine-specific restriction endonuclease McrA
MSAMKRKKSKHDWVAMCRTMSERTGNGLGGGACERCGRPIYPVEPINVHHKKSRSRGGPDEPANLACLCLPCHNWAHNFPAEARKEGFTV